MNSNFTSLQLSGSFKAKINSVFSNGESWLKELPTLIKTCGEQWELSQLEIPSSLSLNFVCFAESAKYGPVALKIGVPHEDLYIQIDSISRFDDKYLCKLYEADKKNCAVLLERITPGYDLASVHSLNERAAIAAQLIKNVPVRHPDATRFPTFSQWLDIAFAKIRNARAGQEDLLQLADQASRLFSSLSTVSSEQRLLHGDLHHFNILYDQHQNNWRAIDPHGVIGYFPLESGRFINNQMGMEKSSEAGNALMVLSKVFAESLGVSAQTIMKCAFIDTVLSTCWTTEESSPDEQDIMDGITYAKIIRSHLGS